MTSYRKESHLKTHSNAKRSKVQFQFSETSFSDLERTVDDKFKISGPTRNQSYLLAFSTLEHHEPVALSTLRGRPQLPQPVGLSSPGHLGVSKGPRRTGRLYDVIQACVEKKEREALHF